MAQQPETTETKPWYKSKIVGIAGAALLVFGGTLLNIFLTTKAGVTPDQIQDTTETVPQVLDIVSRLKSGEGILAVAGSIFSLIILYFRIWGTTTIIPQSIKKNDSTL